MNSRVLVSISASSVGALNGVEASSAGPGAATR